MTLPIARDLMGDGIRVNTILPGIFNTPLLLARARERQAPRSAASVPFPKRLGDPTEYAALAERSITNGYLQRRKHPPRRRHPHGAAMTNIVGIDDAPGAAITQS